MNKKDWMGLDWISKNGPTLLASQRQREYANRQRLDVIYK